MTYPAHHDITVGLLVSLTIMVVLFDIYMKLAAGGQATVSRVIYEVSCANPIIPLAAGVLLGHIFWPVK